VALPMTSAPDHSVCSFACGQMPCCAHAVKRYCRCSAETASTVSAAGLQALRTRKGASSLDKVDFEFMGEEVVSPAGFAFGLGKPVLRC
jgi:hypothetical protein